MPSHLNSFGLSKGSSTGRFKFMVYRVAPPDVFTQSQLYPKKPIFDASGEGFEDGGGGGGEYVCEGVANQEHVTHETLLVCLYDNENKEQVDFVKTAVNPGVHLHSVDVQLPLYKLQNDTKMLMWSILGECPPLQPGPDAAAAPRRAAPKKRIRDIAVVLYPLITHDELECILRTVVPVVRPYYCFSKDDTVLEVSLLSFIPLDASLQPRLAVLGQMLDARFPVTYLAGGDACASCKACVDKAGETIARYMAQPLLRTDLALNLTKLVQKLERKLLCMGNVKGLIVSSKMHNIFNRMQYIEEKYRNMQHHLMTDTTYDGMLTDIEHIESKIKEVAVQLPLSYVEGNNLLHKIVTFKPAGAPPPGAHPAHAHARAAEAGGAGASPHSMLASMHDAFTLPGR